MTYIVIFTLISVTFWYIVISIYSLFPIWKGSKICFLLIIVYDATTSSAWSIAVIWVQLFFIFEQIHTITFKMHDELVIIQFWSKFVVVILFFTFRSWQIAFAYNIFIKCFSKELVSTCHISWFVDKFELFLVGRI